MEEHEYQTLPPDPKVHNLIPRQPQEKYIVSKLTEIKKIDIGLKATFQRLNLTSSKKRRKSTNSIEAM